MAHPLPPITYAVVTGIVYVEFGEGFPGLLAAREYALAQIAAGKAAKVIVKKVA